MRGSTFSVPAAAIVEGGQRRVGGRLVAPARTRHASARPGAPRAPGSIDLRRGALLVALVGERVDADDDPLAGLDRPLDLVGGVADRVRLVAVAQCRERPAARRRSAASSATARSTIASVSAST